MTDLEDITPQDSVVPVFLDPTPIEPGVETEPTLEEQEALRQQAYRAESDGIYMKWQRGEATEQEWLDKVDEIRARYPYPDE